MAALPSTPFTSIDDTRVAVDAPVSTDLFTDVVVDLNYLKAVLTDGALAPQGITASTLTLEGAGTAFTLNNNGHVLGNFQVDGVLSTGVFFSSEDLIALLAL